MKTQMLYRELGKYYNLIYHLKDYKKEVEIVKKLLLKYKKSDGKELLDVGCGTGQHLKYLKNYFSCTGIDVNKEMLEIARKNVKGVVYKQADMIDFNLNKKFDMIICLFSSIGYVRTYSNLKKTIQNFSNNLKTGGVVLIEPWFTKDTFIPGKLHMTTCDGEDIKLVRLDFSRVKGNISIIEMHYLIAEKRKGVKYFSDQHELGLFRIDKTLGFMRDADLKSMYLKHGLKMQRGLYVGIKK